MSAMPERPARASTTLSATNVTADAEVRRSSASAVTTTSFFFPMKPVTAASRKNPASSYSTTAPSSGCGGRFRVRPL
jgi:hypothetical protein